MRERRLARRLRDGLRETRRLTGDLLGLRRRRRRGGVGERRLLDLERDRESLRLERTGVRDLLREGVRDLHGIMAPLVVESLLKRKSLSTQLCCPLAGWQQDSLLTCRQHPASFIEKSETSCGKVCRTCAVSQLPDQGHLLHHKCSHLQPCFCWIHLRA